MISSDNTFTLRPHTPTDPIPSSPCIADHSPLQPAFNLLPAPTITLDPPTSPRVRKRRSSISLSTSGMGLRSPQRSVGMALQRQRQLLMSPGRARSGGAGLLERGGMLGDTQEGEGRSLGKALRGRRKLRLVPAFPPPTGPLPPVPTSPALPDSPNTAPPNQTSFQFPSNFRAPLLDALPIVSRRPLEHAQHHTLNVHGTPLLTPDFADKLVSAMSTVSASPSPIEMESVYWKNGIMEDPDEMKEN